MIKLSMILTTCFLVLTSCSPNAEEIDQITPTENFQYLELPNREGNRPQTTEEIPHVQIDHDIIPEIHEEMIRRVFSIPGIVNEPSVILSWEGLWVEENTQIANPNALISGREFGHIHDDGSLHIFLEPSRAEEANNAGWAIDHPFAAQGKNGWEGFVMLYTPHTIEELNIVFQLIVDAYNYVTGQKINAEDYY